MVGYCENCLTSGVFTFAELLSCILDSNAAGLSKAEIVAILNGVLQILEAQGRDAEFEIVAELVQRISGFFSPHGVIHLKDT
ncbi:hypothetical protein [Sulfuriflexus mobilis]|uniref:hypothetical protein n=1 Tax=Sulfuriflexus mobilis TaxID=1811807 RepID=UPI000F81E12D|nr:hypothetical protein [Sulfuriflexus mobilis]